MAPTGYPSGNHLVNLLLSAGLMLADEVEDWAVFLPVEDKVDAAIRRFREMTGREFDGDEETTETRLFDPPGNPNGIMFFQADLLASPAPVVVSAHVTKVVGTDFWYRPERADVRDRPWEWLEWANLWPFPTAYSLRQSISITGIWRYSLHPPQDVFDAILAGAALASYPELALAISKGLLGTSEKGGHHEYGRYANQGPLTAEKIGWQATWDEGVAAKRKNFTP